MIKVKNNIATREPIPDFLIGLAPESLADLSWVGTEAGVQDCKWLPEIDQSPPLGPYERYGAETLTVGNGVVIVTRAVVPWSAEEIAADKLAQSQALQSSIIAETQIRLDDFAKTRNYDGILSACTYATSAVPKFQAEGQYCVNARDATWSSLYQLFDDVTNGVKPMPPSFSDIEPLLPALEWPT